MSDPFLEREKELMKLNESLNSKMSFDLKAPKTNAKPTNKTKRITTNKTVRDGNQLKNAIMKDANKSKIDSAKKTISATHDKYEKHELDAKDVASIDERPCDIKSTEDQPNTAKLGDTLIETIEKSIDTKLPSNASQYNLIPANVFRKNASTEGIIK